MTIHRTQQGLFGCDLCGMNHPLSMTCEDIMDYDEDEDDEEPHLLEALCGGCGETFNPDNEQDLEHLADSQGHPCGGQGELKGRYTQ